MLETGKRLKNKSNMEDNFRLISRRSSLAMGSDSNRA